MHLLCSRCSRLLGSHVAPCAAVLALVACDARPTEPGPRALTGPRADVSAPVTLGGGFVPPPGTTASGDVVTPPRVTLASVPDSTWVVINTSGQIKLIFNPECNTLPPNWTCPGKSPTANFESVPSSAGPLRLWFQQGSRGSWANLRGSGGFAETPGSAIGLLHQGDAGTLSAEMSLVPVYAWNPNTGGGTPTYYVGGGYSVTVTAVPNPLKLTESAPDSSGRRSYTVEPLYGLAFMNPTGDSRPAGAVSWYFFPGESVSDKPGWAESNAWIGDCQFKTTCQFRPPGPGKVQVYASVERQGVTIRSSGGAPQCQITPGPLGSRSARYSVSGTLCEQTPKIVLSCNPASVTRGDPVTCESQALPTTLQDSLKISEWSFEGHPRTDGDRVSRTWTGPMVTGGMVRVKGTIEGTAVEDSARITVSARSWPEIQITGMVKRVEVDPLSMQDYPPNGIAFGRHQLGYLATDSIQIRTAQSGPNAGYLYLGAPVQILPSTIYVHPALYLLHSLPPPLGPSSPGYSDWRDFYNDQNGIGSGTCYHAAIAHFRRNVERHEGVTLASNSHVGVANRSFRTDSVQSRFERLYSQVDSGDVKYRVVVSFDSLIGPGSAYRARQAQFDSTDTPNVYNIGCSLDMNRSNP